MDKTRSEPSTAPASPAESDDEFEADVDYDDVSAVPCPVLLSDTAPVLRLGVERYPSALYRISPSSDPHVSYFLCRTCPDTPSSRY
jgi:hypothetical protein